MPLQTLNREWGVSIARNIHPNRGTWPTVMVHSPGLAYAFDSNNTGLDSPQAAMDMLTALGLHELTDPHGRAPEALGWKVHADRPDTHDDPRPSALIGPHPTAPIGPIARGPLPAFWLDAVNRNQGWCDVLFVAGVDFTTLFQDEYAPALITAAAEHRVAGGAVRVYC